MTDTSTWHMGRSFDSHSIEDRCPCPSEPCGLVARDRLSPDCDQHPPERCKTMRQSHPPERCPMGERRAWQTDGPMCGVVYGGEFWEPLPCIKGKDHDEGHADWYGRTWRCTP